MSNNPAPIIPQDCSIPEDLILGALTGRFEMHDALVYGFVQLVMEGLQDDEGIDRSEIIDRVAAATRISRKKVEASIERLEETGMTGAMADAD